MLSLVLSTLGRYDPGGGWRVRHTVIPVPPWRHGVVCELVDGWRMNGGVAGMTTRH